MKNTNKNDKLNLLFSAFLIIAFVVCGYFFSELTASFKNPWNEIAGILIYVMFGLVLFYATRVGDGKQVMRLSVSTIVLVVLPTLYILLAVLIPTMPLHTQITQNIAVISLAGVAFGYGIPYSFLSGYELNTEEETEISEEATDETEEASNEMNTDDISEETTEETEENIQTEAVSQEAEESVETE